MRVNGWIVLACTGRDEGEGGGTGSACGRMAARGHARRHALDAPAARTDCGIHVLQRRHGRFAAAECTDCSGDEHHRPINAGIRAQTRTRCTARCSALLLTRGIRARLQTRTRCIADCLRAYRAPLLLKQQTSTASVRDERYGTKSVASVETANFYSFRALTVAGLTSTDLPSSGAFPVS